MSLAPPDGADSARSHSSLQLNLPSNNPFRNRAASPASSGQPSPLDAPPRPVSRNPFLDSSVELLQPATYSQRPIGSPSNMPSAQSKPALSGAAADLFDNLTLDDKPTGSNITRPPPSRPNAVDKMPPPHTTRGENIPPRGASKNSPGHRPSRSEEEAMRARRLAGGSKSRPMLREEPDIFADPADSSPGRRSDSRRPRRNSDSSIMSKTMDSEEERRRQERRRRERRERRDREAKDPKRKLDRKLDIIDKLDVTSIYGTGSFHHDGPFDACNPHRNRQGSRRAPMQAFPKDSLNNIMGGGGPLNKRPDHSTFLGNNDEEAFKDYSKGGVGLNGFESYFADGSRSGKQPDVHSATTRVEPIHGDESLGLGTSTFLEGAPASRAALQRRTSEHASQNEFGGGLGRKKSLAQKIRGINAPRRDYGPSGRATNPEGAYYPEMRTPGGNKVSESNPFFNDFSTGDDTTKKGGVTFVEPERTGRARAPSSPGQRYGDRLERGAANGWNDPSMPPSATPKMGGGFLSRVKSLKGGPRKPKVDRPMPQA